MAEFRIRLAGPEDRDAVRTVIESAYALWIGRLPDMPDMSSGLEEDLAEGPAWLAESESRVTGVLLAAIRDEGLNILNLAVAPEAAGQGQATALLEVAETFARTGGADEMRLTTHRDMTPTRDFYRSRGWNEIEEDGVRVYMSKDQSRG
jgi:ribosomal protein S18 acetylase RimI-like enzyme